MKCRHCAAFFYTKRLFFLLPVMLQNNKCIYSYYKCACMVIIYNLLKSN